MIGFYQEQKMARSIHSAGGEEAWILLFPYRLFLVSALSQFSFVSSLRFGVLSPGLLAWVFCLENKWKMQC